MTGHENHDRTPPPESPPESHPESPPGLPPQSSPDLPPALAGALRDAADRRVFVRGEVDQRILAEARAHLRGAARPRPSPRRSVRWWLPRVAVAACLVIAVGILSREMGMPSRIMNAGEPGAAVAAEGDVDGDGVVDIVDAYVLSKRARDLAGRFDLNEDGAVDLRDAELLAMRVVELNRRTG